MKHAARLGAYGGRVVVHVHLSAAELPQELYGLIKGARLLLSSAHGVGSELGPASVMHSRVRSAACEELTALST